MELSDKKLSNSIRRAKIRDGASDPSSAGVDDNDEERNQMITRIAFVFRLCHSIITVLCPSAELSVQMGRNFMAQKFSHKSTRFCRVENLWVASDDHLLRGVCL